MSKRTRINKIRNYYGNLEVKSSPLRGKYFIRMTCEINSYPWQEITKELYDQLIEFEKL